MHCSPRARIIEKIMHNINDVKKPALVVKYFSKIKVPKFPNESAKDMHILFT
jgi:hypothetical protein